MLLQLTLTILGKEQAVRHSFTVHYSLSFFHPISPFFHSFTLPSQAYYNRGLTKMKLKHAKSIHDFNRALAINPKLFQAFLSRAAYYGTKGRFSKGIMNCNEAIKLQPRSVRAYLYR